MNVDQWADITDFDPKILCHGNVPWMIGKRERDHWFKININYLPCDENLSKIVPVDPKNIIGLNGLF